MTVPGPPGASQRQFSWRNVRQVLWPDFAKLQMGEQERRLLPTLLVGHGILSASEIVAGGLFAAVFIAFADGRPFMYCFAAVGVWFGAFGVLGLLHAVRTALWARSRGGRDDD